MGMAPIGVQTLVIMGIGCLVLMITILLINASLCNGTRSMQLLHFSTLFEFGDGAKLFGAIFGIVVMIVAILN